MDTTHRKDLALGTMWFGTRQDAERSYALLDHYVARGGRWLDTSDNYAFWESPSGNGGASETVIGNWPAGIRAYATRWRSRPRSARTRRCPARGTRRWRVSAHAPSKRRSYHRWPVSAWTSSICSGGTSKTARFPSKSRSRRSGRSSPTAGCADSARRTTRPGASNAPAPSPARADWPPTMPSNCGTATSSRSPSCRFPTPDTSWPTAETLDYVASEGLGMWAYTTLLSGAYARTDRLQHAYRHPDTDRRLAALDRVARRLDATRNQVVLAWLIGGTPAVTPIVGVSDIAQLDEAMDALALQLDAEARAVLDGRDAQ